mmetsp:Transcript_15437/g.48683  ORF Transcript_15437/g.48683 Transcript_15437/m.48683 type:complete len:219 (-) Transcript_15437:653-1309(-)
MFWPNSRANCLDLAQVPTCVTASVFPQPGPPFTKTMPRGLWGLCSCASSTRCSSAFTGHSSQERSWDCRCLLLCTKRESTRPVNWKTSTLRLLPFRATPPRDSNSRNLRQASCVASSTSTAPSAAQPMRRAARFTTSPRTVYSRRCEVPTTPHQQVPVATPARPSTPSSWSVSQRRMAVSTARMGSSEKWFTGGSPNTARSTMPLSLMSNLFMLPSNA